MNYKGQERYGTTLGGCISCFVFYFLIAYVILVGAGIVIGGRNLDSTVLTGYNGAVEGHVYEYDLTPYDLIPVTSIRSGSIQTGFTFNDPSLWRFQFLQYNGLEEIPIVIQPITCDKYIEKYLGGLNDEQRNSINNQLGGSE